MSQIDPNRFYLDFEADGEGAELSLGQVIDDEFESLGISVFAVRDGEPLNRSGPNRAFIFDSSNPTGGDTDLRTPNLGNILIISEDGDTSDPDDNARGGTFFFDFDSPRDLNSIGFVDIEERGGKIRAFDAYGDLISVQDIPTTRDGGQFTLDVDIENAVQLEVYLVGSGAISKFGFDSAGVGDFVFEDTNGNGIQDDGEEGVEGVTVSLLTGGADGLISTTDDNTVVTNTTDSNGFYDFQGLAAGDEFQLSFDLPRGFEFTDANVGGNEALDSDVDPATGQTEIFTLNPGEFNSTFDAGIVALPTASLGDRVFNDLNQNGIQDRGEPGVKGILVSLNTAGDDGEFGTADDVLERTAVTDDGGFYQFTDLTPGIEYQVNFSNLPEGFEFTDADVGGDEFLDSDAAPDGSTDVISLAPGEVNNDIDAGIVGLPASLGNRVFDDRNQNGIQDPGEFGVGGVLVTLSTAGDDGEFGTADDVIEGTRTTGAQGFYRFRDLTPGIEYQVNFSNLPDGFEFTTQDQGTNDLIDSDADPTTGNTDVIILAPGEDNLSIDAGIFLGEPSAEKGEIIGTPGTDFLAGTTGSEIIRGLGESDTIRGFEGNDHLFGNSGFDILFAGAGADKLFGGLQDDTLFGEGGNDVLSGGSGNDLLVGGGGRDTLDGTNVNGDGANEFDTLRGGAGPDRFVLGVADTQYYLGDGFATIQDFNADQDVIQLQGSVGDFSTNQQGADLELTTSGGDVIAILQNTSSLNLDDSQSVRFV